MLLAVGIIGRARPILHPAFGLGRQQARCCSSSGERTVRERPAIRGISLGDVANGLSEVRCRERVVERETYGRTRPHLSRGDLHVDADAGAVALSHGAMVKNIGQCRRAERLASQRRRIQTQCIDENMAFLAFDQLASIEPMSIDAGPLFRAFHALAIDDAGSGTSLGFVLLAAFDVERVMDFLQRAVVAPAGEVLMHRAARRQVFRNIAPLTSALQHCTSRR